MCHPNRFYSHHGLQTRPFRQFRKGGEGGDGPDSPPYGPTVRVIEGIKEVLGSTPGQVGFDVLMQVLFDRRIGLCVIALQGQEIVATLVPDVLRDGGLTAHRINGDNTALDGSQLEEVRHGSDLIGLCLCLDLAYYKAPLVRTPRREHVQGGRGCSTVKGRSHGFAVERDECPLGELCDGLGPGQEVLLKALGIEAGTDAAKGVVGGNAMRQGQEGLQPCLLALAKECHILEPFASGQQCA
jgi:hypothetical protein